ncbi:MAG: carboxypeptidase regulatory-like domain-containing protein [Armatimonadetes bacterium]|nr:carboxypeptidase regulatory-like domain-containing protein [Armatimonadota bacterium]
MRVRTAVTALVLGVILLVSTSVMSAVVTHTVRKGESLADIARIYNVPLSQLIQLNRARFPRGNPDLLYTGTRISVPVKKLPPKPASPTTESKQTPAAALKPPSAPAPDGTPQVDAKPVPAPSKVSEEPHKALENLSATEDRRFPPEKNVSSLSPEARKAAEQQIYGTVTDAQSRPIDGVNIVTDHGNYVSTSKSDGSYFIAGVEQGTYTVTASKAGFGPQSLSGIVVKQGQRSPASFRLGNAGVAGWSASWLLLAGLIVLVLVAVLVLMVRMTGAALNAAEPRDSSLLRLIATRNLGRNARVHWLRADDRDFFVTEGVGVHVLQTDSLREPEALPSSESSAHASTRRPRKSGPSSSEEP